MRMRLLLAPMGSSHPFPRAVLYAGRKPMWRPDPYRFVFVTGKGGAGKTTVSAAMALAAAGRGKRVLIAMCNAKERLSSMFGTELLGPEIAKVADNVWGVNIEPEHAFAEYGQMILKVPALYRTVFQNRYVRSFLPAVPGLSEWAMLGKAWFHTTETDEAGRPRFDLVLLDAPATGHGLDMLRVPKVILEVVPPGILRRDAERAWQMFRDPAQTSVLVVTLPEELPTTETIELTQAVQHELGLPLGAVVVNSLLATLFSPAEREVLGRATDPMGSGVIAAATRRAELERLEAESVARLRKHVTVPKIELPFLFGEAGTRAALEVLASRF
jgi:anion-transporting  ArsA/GET3 family ATPase